MNETVRKHCIHLDCKYRGLFDSEPCCKYMLVTGKRRGCDISVCDKYESGVLETKSELGGFFYKI